MLQFGCGTGASILVTGATVCINVDSPVGRSRHATRLHRAPSLRPPARARSRRYRRLNRGADDRQKRGSVDGYRRSITIMPDSVRSRISARNRPGSMRRSAPWTVEEVLEQVAWAGEDAKAVA